MIAFGGFAAFVSLISLAWAIYSGNRKHKLMVKQYEDKKRYFKRLSRQERKTVKKSKKRK